MTKKILFIAAALIIYIILIAIAVNLISKFPIYDKLIVAIFGAITVFIGYIIKPIYEEIERVITTPSEEKRACKIYLFGLGSCGKTTLIKSWIGGDVDNRHATQGFKYYTRTNIPINQKNMDAILADYQGQEPAQIVDNIIRNNKLNKKPYTVNVILFIVDIVGVDDKGNILTDLNSQISYLTSNTEEKIKARVLRHRIYIEGALNFLFYFMKVPDLTSVRLVVNKYDVLREIVQQGNIPNVRVTDIQTYVKTLFMETENVLSNICKQNNIADFSVDFISAKDNSGTAELLDSILRVYDRHLSNQVKKKP